MNSDGTRSAAVSVPGVVVWPLVVAGLVGIVWGAYAIGKRDATTQVVAVGPRIEDIRRIAKLAVLRVQVADVIEGTTPGARAVVLVRGDADIAVDLDQAEITRVDEEQRKLTLAVPAPRADRPRVDHDRTRVYELCKTGLAALNPFADPREDLLEDCMRAAQHDVEAALTGEEFVDQAKAQAESLLGALHHGLGWEVTVEWREPVEE